MYDVLRRTPIARPRLGLPAPGKAGAPRPSTADNEPTPVPLPVTVELEVWQELDQLVDELSILREPPVPEALESAGLLEQAYEELGIALGEQGYEAERARAEALRRDARAVTVRFERWFPDPDELGRGSDAAPPAELLEVIEIVVRTVSELTDYLAAPTVSRRVDAIELLERLLLEAGVSPWAYTRALPHATAPCREALRALRGAAFG